MNFKTGDRVVVIRKRADSSRLLGLVGTIIGSSVYSTRCCIEFDRYISGHNGQTGRFRGKDGHCWWVDNDCLSLCKDIKFNNNTHIFKR